MAKGSLSVASSEPVSLPETTSGNAKSSTVVPDSAETTEIKIHKKEKEEESKSKDTTSKELNDDLEEVDVNEKTPASTNEKPGASAAEKKDVGTTDAKPIKSINESSKKAASTEKSASPKITDKSGTGSDAPPQPARPVSPLEQIKRDLKDAFPQIEDKYIEASLIASEGRVDPAFNALLYLSDPSFKPEPVLSGKKAPVADEKPLYTDDELLARQLQKEFDREERRQRNAASKARKRNAAPQQDEEESPDEIDQLKEQFSQGFEEAKTTINGWVSGLTKKFSQEGETGNSSGSSNQNTKLFGALGGSSFNSGTKNRPRKFDEDPEILSSDFSRRVDLQDNNPPKLPTRTDKKEQEKRWQPLNSDVPVNSDAFLVTDSEDEDRK